MTALRNLLPSRRAAETFDIEHRGHKATVTVGRYDTGKIGEVFITTRHTGSDLESTARDAAVLISIALQHGVPVEVLAHAVTRNGDGSPATILGAVLDRMVER